MTQPSPPPTVLVADDSYELRVALEMVLHAAGYRVVAARDGAEAVRLAAAERPDMVLLDLMMPEMDGYTAAAHLRALPGERRIPILAISANFAPEDAERAAALFDGRLPKPIRAGELLRCVAECLRPAAPSADPVPA